MQTLRDLIALAKPRITLFVVLTTLGGFWLAHTSGGPGHTMLPISWELMTWSLLGTALIVSGANALNMYVERESDKFMARTANRPLPAGRMTPSVALAFGLALTGASLPMLYRVNTMTMALGALASALYVLAYTPLKRKSHYSLLVGAVPGALPPLMGWTSVTGVCSAGGLVLFAILFFWQVPHSLAIALFRADDYKNAGLEVLPNAHGHHVTHVWMLQYTVALLGVSLLLAPLGITSWWYAPVALLLGIGFLVRAWRMPDGAKDAAGLFKWARGVFFFSLIYLVALFVAIAVFAVS